MAAKKGVSLFKIIRIGTLLIVLMTVAIATYKQKTLTADWSRPINVVIYPISGEPESKKVSAYIAGLNTSYFTKIKAFFEDEAQAFNKGFKPDINIVLGKQILEIPPPPPRQGAWSIRLWSLKLRWWLFRNISSLGLDVRRINVFVIYHEGEEGKPLQHSFGLQKGLVGVVHAFARKQQTQQNNIVIAHEILHTLGATDKYGNDGQPLYPIGYGEPKLKPLVPQRYAEIMAGRRMISQREYVMPNSLDECVIGIHTAREIKW